MSIIREEYAEISPSIDYLFDEVVLMQAWKKSQGYIRRFNWYADVLELDFSTIDLDNRIMEWKSDLQEPNFKTDDMRLVMAPKNQEWHFSDVEDVFELWSYKNKGDAKLDLRPLAHITIRDQVFATAVMICLADSVESAQGPTEELDFLKAQEQAIYSYGNRLQCTWIEGPGGRKRAQFAWGSSSTYRKYYDDYKVFLQRPQSICQHYASIASPNNRLYTVSLDLEKFYDCIDRKALLKTLKNLYKSYNEEVAQDSQQEFWSKAKKILSFKWSELDQKNNELSLPDGVPQGLVAGGFFANAYMVDLDRRIGSNINKEKTYEDGKIIIRDYCRYVDDLRIVVEASADMTVDKIEEIMNKEITGFLERFELDMKIEKTMKLNHKKTKVAPYAKISTQNNVSAVMNMYQGILSGTPDIESLKHAFSGLEGLLEMSQLLKGSKGERKNKLELSIIDSPQIDVRDDTLKRFAASKMVQVLRLQRSLTDLDEKVDYKESELGSVTVGDLLDQEFESVARKLIALWAKNPSLTLLLKFGLDLYPDQKIISPVIDALRIKVFANKKDKSIEGHKEIRIAEYISADLLFACTTYISYGKDSVYPEKANINEFREELAFFSKEILASSISHPWYLLQSAALFLISIGDYSFSIKSNEPELELYKTLLKSALYKSYKKVNVRECLAASLIIQQIKPDKSKFVSWYINWMNKINKEEDRATINKVLLDNNPDLMHSVYHSKSKRRLNSELKLSVENISYMENYQVKEIKLVDKTEMSLLKIIQSDLNPFYQENALLLLIKQLLASPDSIKNLEQGASVMDITIECTNWTMIQNPEKSGKNFLKVKFSEITEKEKPLFPIWIQEGHEWLYALGRIVRACITGQYDFTINNFFKNEEVKGYKGLRNTTFTRAFGLNNTAMGLVGNWSPVSPWLMEFINKALQWPGILRNNKSYEQIGEMNNKKQVLDAITQRIIYQCKIYGNLSNSPSYVYPIGSLNRVNANLLRVAIVQPLLPNTTDFDIKNPLYWSPSFRKRHRSHIATVCKLVESQIRASNSANLEQDKNVDLIIFPELSVHYDDIDLLRGLSDKTKATIFAGLCFLQDDVSGKLINQAIWLIRNEKSSGRDFVYIFQGKKHMTTDEKSMGIQEHRPYQLLVEFEASQSEKIRVAGAICYDATDLSLASDLRDVSDVYAVAAMNKDVQTFDNMVAALQYHMYQPVLLANTGEFGGSTAQAPYSKPNNLLTHMHGNNQLGVSIFDVDAIAFKHINKAIAEKVKKSQPAGYSGRKW